MVSIGDSNEYLVSMSEPVILERTPSRGPKLPGPDKLEFMIKDLQVQLVNGVEVK